MKIFPRQVSAFEYADAALPRKLHVYSFELEQLGEGLRRYLVASDEEFFNFYQSIPETSKHFYEVIRESHLCHLYFDLEYSREYPENSSKRGETMVGTLLSELEDFLKQYSLSISSVACLDSSTRAKFSNHLIIRLHCAALFDSNVAGVLVEQFSNRLIFQQHRIEIDQLFVKTNDDEISPRKLFIDTSVYSKNRNFRLVFSSKLGKSAYLQFCLVHSTIEFTSKRDCFFQSLVVARDFSEISANRIVRIEDLGRAKKRDASVCDSMAIRVSNSSEFPLVDEFVLRAASVGTRARIGSVLWFADRQLLVYAIADCRYCHRIAREHRSNHVYYVCDLRARALYQKCHDPDCKSYRYLVPQQVPDHAH